MSLEALQSQFAETENLGMIMSGRAGHPEDNIWRGFFVIGVIYVAIEVEHIEALAVLVPELYRQSLAGFMKITQLNNRS